MNKTPCTTVTNYSNNLNYEDNEERKILIQMISLFDDYGSKIQNQIKKEEKKLIEKNLQKKIQKILMKI